MHWTRTKSNAPRWAIYFRTMLVVLGEFGNWPTDSAVDKFGFSRGWLNISTISKPIQIARSLFILIGFALFLEHNAEKILELRVWLATKNADECRKMWWLMNFKWICMKGMNLEYRRLLTSPYFLFALSHRILFVCSLFDTFNARFY